MRELPQKLCPEFLCTENLQSVSPPPEAHRAEPQAMWSHLHNQGAFLPLTMLPLPPWERSFPEQEFGAVTALPFPLPLKIY